MTDSSKRSRSTGRRPATVLVHGGNLRSEFMETSEAIFMTSGYTYPDAETAQRRMAGEEPGFVYSRYANPTLKMLEDKLCEIEGAEACRVTASGMAAISASLTAPVKSGDRVLASRALFGSCTWIMTNVLPKFGVTCEFVDGADLSAWEEALSTPARLVLVESPSNPLLDAVDIAAVAELTHKAGGELIVDNVFATPMLQRPLEMGADWVTYSCTKHMDGQGRVLGGAILGRAKDMEEVFDAYLKHTGPALSPFNAWTILKGLETLDLRVERMSASAARLADFLADQPQIAAVRYPGRKDHPHHDIHDRQMGSSGGTLIAISLKGGKDAAFKMLNGLELVTISNNLGDAKSLICHPATTTHRTLSDEQKAAVGLDDSWVRLSVGLEDADDLCEDFQQALANLPQSA